MFPVKTGHRKYKGVAHKRERAAWARVMQQQGHLTCAQPECVMPTRTITPGQPWHLGHDDTGTHYIGPTHAKCNIRDGAKRGNRKSRGVTGREHWPM